MNRILLHPRELDAGQRCVLAHDDYRVQHLQKVLRAEAGQRFEAGILGTSYTGELVLLRFASNSIASNSIASNSIASNNIASGSIESNSIASDSVKGDLEFCFFGEESSKELAKQNCRLRMVLGLMRPAVLKRLLRDLASAGVEEIILLQADLCEGDYSKSHIWQNLERYLILGAEQGRINRLPKLSFVERGGKYKGLSVQEFLQEQDVQEFGRANCVLLDGHFESRKSATFEELCYVAVGPERGWTTKERELFLAAGFVPHSLGPFTLRTELAAHAALILYSY